MNGASNGSADGHAQGPADSKPTHLPHRDPDRMWGGPSPGGPCAVCHIPLKRNELEMELEFRSGDSTGADRYHLHVGCFAAWQSKKATPTPT